MSENANVNWEDLPPSSDLEEQIAMLRLNEEADWLIKEANLRKQVAEEERESRRMLPPLNVDEMFLQMEHTLEGMRVLRDEVLRKNNGSLTRDLNLIQEYSAMQGGVIALSALLRALKVRRDLL